MSRTFTFTPIAPPPDAGWTAALLRPAERRDALAEREAEAIARLLATVARSSAVIVAWQIESPSFGRPSIADVEELDIPPYMPFFATFADGPTALAAVLRAVWPYAAPEVYPVASRANLSDVRRHLERLDASDAGPVGSGVRRWVEERGAYMATYGTDGVIDHILVVSDGHDLRVRAAAAFGACGVRLELTGE